VAFSNVALAGLQNSAIQVEMVVLVHGLGVAACSRSRWYVAHAAATSSAAAVHAEEAMSV
jgi:hypothetical protein